MTSTRKMLLGTAAATIAVTGGASTGAQAADALLKKAAPIQYVRVCDRYGYGFFQIPGSAICLQLRGQMQSDNAIQPTHDIEYVVMDTKKGGAPTPTIQFANQQDKWGYEVTAKPRFDARTETSMGTLRAYVEVKVQLDAGAFNGPPGPGQGETGAGNKSELYRGYLQWAGWTIGEADSIWSLGNFKDGDIADVVQTDKASGWTAYYTITPSGPGVPPIKGSAPIPDGWSFSFGADTPLKHISKAQFGTGNYQYLFLSTGGVGATTGAITIPDFVARLHYAADPPGKDDQHNDQFGIGDFHLAAAYHQLTTIALGGAGLVPGTTTAACGNGGNLLGNTCAFGPELHDTGWAATAYLKFFVPMWAGTKLGANRSSAADNIQLGVNYSHGASEYAGSGGTAGNLNAGDAYWTGGLVREDTDGRLFNNGNGTYSWDKENILAFNAQYHSILTDCTDPVKCVALTLEANYVWATPGTKTQNTDWTDGGLSKGNKLALTAELSFGISRNGTTMPTFWRWDTEVQYLKVWQSLPNNCNGGMSACLAPTALPTGIALEPDSWVWRNTITMDW